ncbi:hypothetical protein [Paraburkholderia ferrariae]|jgi:hypothetical protein|uniref:hypothetical protein n=1 Tax=Paraburkholderia ferrariae TaxID=386056 RepID=UPI0012ECA2B3|nr:hypothetical protein [Paraburkholderia ferrariae]
MRLVLDIAIGQRAGRQVVLRRIGGTRNDRPPYRDLKREALFYARQIPLDFDAPGDGVDEPLVDCFCGD